MIDAVLRRFGRMRRAGLVRHAPSEGSTLWEVTDRGREEAAR